VSAVQIASQAIITPEIPITKSSPYTFKPAVAVTLPDVLAGDVWSIWCQMEVTNSHDSNVMVARYLEAVQDGNTVTLARAMGQNTNLAEHHYTMTLAPDLLAAADGPVVVTAYLYSACSAALSGWLLETQYVEMAATLISREVTP